MALIKLIRTVFLRIEVQSRTDNADDAIYSKKTFSDVKTYAITQNVYYVAEAIKDVLKTSTGVSFINKSSSLINTYYSVS